MDIYRPPDADVGTTPEVDDTEAPPFYVVSTTKFLTLFVATFGIYQLYWFFRNWKLYRARSTVRLSPFWRTVFSIFFTHRLFGLMQQYAVERDASLRWPHQVLATLYIVLIIGGRLLSRLGSPDSAIGAADVASLLAGFAAAYPLFVAQRAANIAGGDPDGSSNSRLTGANFLFIVLGAFFWLLVLAGLFLETVT